MTDTGQIPGEGLPENGVGEAALPPHTGLPGNGVPQQSGWGTDPLSDQGAPGYSFLDHPAAPGTGLDYEDDVLLMPGPQGSWSDPQPVPPQPPIAVPAGAAGPMAPPHGAHHAANGAGPYAGPSDTAGGQTPPAPRRPLHMGPPIPDTPSGGVSVRSLADRGPAVRASGPPTSGPEYLDVPPDDSTPIPAQQTGDSAGPAVPVPGSAWPAAPAAIPSQHSLIPHADSVVQPQGGLAPAASIVVEAVASAPVEMAPPPLEAPPAAPLAPEPPGFPAVVDGPQFTAETGQPGQPAPGGEALAPVAGGTPAAGTPVPAAVDTPSAGTPLPAAAPAAAAEPAFAPDAPAAAAAPAPVAAEPAAAAAAEPVVAEAVSVPAVSAAPAEPVAPAAPVDAAAPAAVPLPPHAVAPAAPEAAGPSAGSGTPPEGTPVAVAPVATDSTPAAGTPAAEAGTWEAAPGAPVPATEAVPAAPAAPPAPVVAEPVALPVPPTAESAPAAEDDVPVPVAVPSAPEPAVAAAQPAPAETQAVALEQAPSPSQARGSGKRRAPAVERPAPEPAAPEPAAPAPIAPAAAPEPVAEPAIAAAVAAEPVAEPAEAPQSAESGETPAAEAYEPAVRDAVHRVIRERRDIRNGFRSDPIPHDVLLRVLEAAHTAPSVGHSQPWDFVVIRSDKTREKMHELAMRQREAYAKTLPKGRARQFRELKIEAILDTPVNIVVTSDSTRGGRHTLGRHTQPQMAPYSSALAVENLWLAARAEGLGVGWVSFFDERQMVAELGLPEHLEVVAYLCVGYVDEFPDEPELTQSGWSARRPLSWVVHDEEYGNRALPGEEPHDLLEETLRGIRPLDAKALGEAWERQKRMTKPAGALGMLEIISAQLSGLSRVCPPPIPEPAAVAIFAGDHGVHAQGVTAWPQEVTGQMVANFLGGGAVCNAFANQVGAEVCVIDVGVASELPSRPGLLPRKVRPGTADFTAGPAMTRDEALRAIEVGIETARDLVAAGNRALLTGEMGIANTTTSAALIAVFTGADPAEVTGRGTGINDEMHARKIDVVRRALELHRPDPADPIAVLTAIGGLEHAAMVGLLLGAAALRTPVILDGVSAGAAALVARAIAPEVLAACIAGHRSAEPGHVAALTTLGLRPLVDLDLRLGEGTGALLALPLVQSAARVMHEVATFDAAGVTEKS